MVGGSWKGISLMSHGVHMLGLLPNREKIFSRSQQYSFMETKVCFRTPSDKG